MLMTPVKREYFYMFVCLFSHFMYTVKIHKHVKYRSLLDNYSISIYYNRNVKENYLYIVFSLCVICLA